MGSSSNVEMEIIPFNVAGTASVVVTGQNKQPYFGSVEVGNADGPYVVVDEFMLLSSDGDEVIEYGETVNISMTLKNVGNEITSGITVTLSINDEYITLIDDQSAFGDLMPEETITLENVFSFNVASQVPDDYSFSMVANVWGSGQFWDYNLNMAAFAPVLSFEGVEVVSELDGQLDPGDTADIGVIIHNSGGSDLSGMNVIISSEDEYVTINGDSNYFLDNLNVDESATAYYNLSADSNTPIGHIMSFNIMVTASGSYEEDLFGSLTVGLTWEDFESGSFVGLPWNFSGNADWQISSDGYEGMYGAESGSISDNETSELNVSANVTAGDDISFYYKVSSEGSYDYLRFYIDGVEQGAWSGDIGWTQASFSVSPGEHLFRWVYSKDGSVSSGSDMAWIDYIVFPPIGAPMFPEINISIDELSLDLEVDSQEVEQFVISNSGEGDLQYNIQVVLDSPESSIQHESIKLDKGANDAREGMLFDRGSGGPDAFGYTWIDSDELGGPATTWIEIDFCGIPIGNGDDSNEGPFELGFPFYFYGNEYNSVRVSTNGFLSFTSTATSYTNQSIPSNGDPNALLAPFWDDLNPSSGGQMYYFSWGDHFVVQWDEVPLYSGGGSETFQVVLYADGRILFNYKTVTAVDGCTVGIENESGTDGLQVVFNSNYLHDDMTILFSSDFLQPWLNVFPITGVLSPSEESIISVSFDSNQLLDGIYTGNLNVYSNDPSQTLVALPVAMVVGSECSNPGDANGDGEVSILDIIRLINCILDDECGPCYDLNDDGSVNIQDIISIINIILD
ncbi:MAG: nidogen-like domain-containing protein, partial [Candidatus Neomarinimicrobiota bacterium]|nr:nidogen-like domain-containing protein [Candidatus Neomarinimicrobiota bacterium]